MSLFPVNLYIDGSLHVSGPQAHLQENSHSCSHNHWFSIRTVLLACSVYIQNTRPERYGYWTNGCGNSCVNSSEDGPVDPKHIEIPRYMNKIETVTSVGFSFLMSKREVWQSPSLAVTSLYILSSDPLPITAVQEVSVSLNKSPINLKSSWNYSFAD